MLRLAAGALVFLFAVALPIAIHLICYLDLNKWAVPAGSVVGKTAIVTGANSGLGLETARVLAAEGAKVVMACRSTANCKEAMEVIRQTNPRADLVAQQLDLADPDSVHRFAAEFLASHSHLHLLVNNAAVMAIPFATAQWPGARDVEMQFATNHLGPFLLTGLLQKILEATPGSRVINHSSSASDHCHSVKDIHKMAAVQNTEYHTWESYSCSKRANRYFTWSLNQRLSGVLAVACHPGWTGTNLQHRATGLQASLPDWLFTALWTAMNAAYAQPPSLGAQPQLFAATQAADSQNNSGGGVLLKGGEVLGPRFYMFGTPVVETADFCDLGSGLGQCEQADLDALWTLSETLAGFTYSRKS